MSYYYPGTIARPDISQCIIHMLLYYSGCRIETSVNHLVQSGSANAPAMWQEHIHEEFEWLLLLQQIYSTRFTVQIPAPVCLAAYIASGEDGGDMLAHFSSIKPEGFRMVENIPQFLTNWNPAGACRFDVAWWVEDNMADASKEDIFLRMTKYAARYFQGQWGNTISPFDEAKHRLLDKMEEECLQELTENMQELEELDAEINHSRARELQLRRLLGDG